MSFDGPLSSLQYFLGESTRKKVTRPPDKNAMKTCFEDLKNIEVLYDLFDSTDSQQIQGMVCRAFCILCTNSSVFTYLMSKKEDRPSLCPALTKLLSSADHDVIEEVILLLLALSHHNSGHSDLERESLLQAIIETINKSNSEKCIHCCVQYCSNFGAQKRKHKTVLLELEMVPCLSSIIQRDYSSATIKMCKDLMDSLVIRVPSQEMSGVIVRAEQQNTKRYSVVAPEIHWTQNSFNVMLSVKVKGVSNSPDLVKVNEDMVIFRAIVDGMTYGFTYKLFDKVMPEHNRIRVKSSEVLISMKKVEKGKWPRLLHQKQKPSNLSIDFERFVDSSDSEFSNEDEPFMLKRKKKAKLFSGKDAPRRNVGSPELAEDSGTDTSDSLENMDDREKDRFSIFE